MIDKYTNCFDSPFLIFIKGVNHLSDKQVLQLLGLNTFKIIDSLEDREKSLYITRSTNWIHIMDNWLYDLWHSTPFKNSVDKLGKEYDIFYCSVGDCDNSFDWFFMNSVANTLYH
ncbi:hypothetical protein ACE193_22180 [Bernardetia sp. OM2101]|uniref:hypothetical protein n=1 Tax=Bernardetia sp. OM2101 TaxID=3344876 RepID=UPI0035D1306C